MKEIGNAFKEARESIGITKEEVIKDLNITMGQLDNLEDGNSNAFKDVFFLKELVGKYAKYLNLDENKIISEFNDFIFSYTSRILIDDILEQTREINLIEKKNNADKVVSPYTKDVDDNKKKMIFLMIAGIVVFAIIALVAVSFIINNLGA